MSTLPVHKELEALARDPFSLNPFTWADVKERIDTLIADAKLDWSEEVIQRERGRVPHMRAHLYVLQLQYIAIRGTNKVMHLLRDAAAAATEIGLVEHIQQACHRFEKTREKYDKLHSLLGPAGAPEAHGYFRTWNWRGANPLTKEQCSDASRPHPTTHMRQKRGKGNSKRHSTARRHRCRAAEMKIAWRFVW
jgi:hypothetical protein